MTPRGNETAAVRHALGAAGITARVTHGRGTAYGWIEVDVGPSNNLHHEGGMDLSQCSAACPEHERMRALRAETLRVVRAATGRHGEHDGNVLILSQDVRVVQAGRWAPEAWAPCSAEPTLLTCECGENHDADDTFAHLGAVAPGPSEDPE